MPVKSIAGARRRPDPAGAAASIDGGHVRRPGRFPVAEAVGVGLADGIAGDRLELGVRDHDLGVDVVPETARYAGQASSLAWCGRVEDVVADLQWRTGPEVEERA